MTAQSTNTSAQPRNLWRSAAAVFSGFVVIVVLSLGTDQLLHSLDVYLPWGKPMYSTGLLLLALGYRCVYGIMGSYVTALLAPRNPMRHVMVGAVIGLVLSTGGVIAAMNRDLGPIWYPIALLVTALPCAWLGGILHRRWHAKQ